jgi:hypothetical protein
MSVGAQPNTGAPTAKQSLTYKWDETTSARLKDLVVHADQCGVVVELVFFCTMYDDKVWEASPMNVRNNVNGIGRIGKYEVYSAKEEALLKAQRAVVRKLVAELNPFDNLYYEVCNEPTNAAD